MPYIKSTILREIACLALLLGGTLGLRAQCLQITCGPNKTVSCGTAWSFGSPTVTNSCDCSNRNYTLVVESTVTNSTACTNQFITQTWRVTASCGQTNYCSQTVTVLFTNPPVFQGADNITVYSCSNVPVNFNVTASDPCCGTVGVTCTPASGSVFPSGRSTPVQCVASDCCGKLYTNTFTVTVANTNQVVFQGASPITVESWFTPIRFRKRKQSATVLPMQKTGTVTPSIVCCSMPADIISPEKRIIRRAGTRGFGGRVPRGTASHTSLGFSVVRS